MPPHNRNLLYILAAILLLIPWSSATAQSVVSEQESEVAQQGAPVSEEPQPILEGELQDRADLVAADLRRIEALLQPIADSARVDATLSNREAEIVLLRGQLDRIDPARISTRRLQDQRLPWLELRAELDGWAAVVRGRFGIFQEERERLREERRRWEVTAESVDVEELAPELLRRIDTFLGRVRDVEGRVRERRNQVGALADRISTSQETVAESLDRIDALAEAKRAALFERRAAPLWRVFARSDDLPVGEDMVYAGEDWTEAFLAYVELRRGRLVFLLLLFAALLVGAFGLRRQSRNWPAGDPAAEKARDLAGRPLSLALAFSVGISLLLLPNPVGSAADVLLLLAVIPFIRLGSVVFSPDVRRDLYGVAALTILVRIAAVGPYGSLVTRLLLLLVTVIALAGTASVVPRARRSGERLRGWRRAEVAAASVAAFVLGAALIANFVGWLELSALLTKATVISLFAAFTWAIVVRATAALVPVLIDGSLGQLLPSLRRNRAVVSRTVVAAVTVLAVVLWTRSTLLKFHIWDPLRDYVASLAGGSLSIGGLTVSPGGVLAAILILFATRLIARLVGFIVREEVLPRLRAPRGAGHSMATLVNYAVYGVGIALAASAAGLSGTQVTVVVGALGVGIGFGLQNIVSNFISGLILIFERPIKVGDVVQTTQHWGTIRRIGIRASIIRSFDGAEIMVPNTELIAKEVINWTRSDDVRRIEVLVGVKYGTEPEQVLEILLRVAGEHPLTLEDPGPQAHMLRFGESSLDFRLRCWVRMEDWVNVASNLHVSINRELKTAGITIPFPQRDLHVRSGVGGITEPSSFSPST
jgi:small-conductance mechanosensitive channel